VRNRNEWRDVAAPANADLWLTLEETGRVTAALAAVVMGLNLAEADEFWMVYQSLPRTDLYAHGKVSPAVMTWEAS
jgi:hypothetical protein